jgi:hypothetical protein
LSVIGMRTFRNNGMRMHTNFGEVKKSVFAWFRGCIVSSKITLHIYKNFLV